MYCFLLLVLISFADLSYPTDIPSVKNDLVTSLPGIGKIPFDLYSGYLDIDGGKHFHYVFAESMNDSDNDPLVLWLTGGPGCSSLLSFWSEQGPFRFDRHSGDITMNDYAWNKVANMIFLESPAGVGYSYSESKNYTTDDDQISLDNLNAVKAFFEKFPQFKTNKFFVTGEGYAANWLATLSVRLLDQPNMNFEGLAIGNGLFDSESSLFPSLSSSYHHGILLRPYWESIVKSCNCPALGPCDLHANSECENAVYFAVLYLVTWMSVINPYDVYGRCDFPLSKNESDELLTPFYQKKVKVFQRNLGQEYPIQNSGGALWCLNYEKLIDFMNRADVRSALNIPDSSPNWSDCSRDVNMGYERTYKNIRKQILQVLNAGKYAMFYSGDTDMLFPFASARWFIDSLDLQSFSNLPWADDDGQVAGWIEPFGQLMPDPRDVNFTLVTVRGAGHFVPQSKPSAALKLFKAFLEKKLYMFP